MEPIRRMEFPHQTSPDQALAQVLRRDRGRILSALISRVRDFQLAEDALHEAAAAALIHWSVVLPHRPEAWLIKVAFRKAIDLLRQRSRDQARADAMAVLARDEAADDPDAIADDRLRLIFTCCHPALDPKSRVALTLRTIAGLTTAEIARAFLDQEATMAQRLTRAKTKIAAAGIPFVIPGPEDWDDRLQSVLSVTYLIFNAGYTAGPGEVRDLCAEAIFLARLINDLRPGEPEVEGALALMVLTHARSPARVDASGATVALTEQDRRLWNQSAITEGRSLIDQAMARRLPGPYQVKAAIAACQMQPHGPDWPQISLLYASLYRMEPTPVVQLNRAVALAETGHLHAALSILQTLSAPLTGYQPFHAAMAEYLARSGQQTAARAAYDRAIALAPSKADAALLTRRRDAV